MKKSIVLLAFIGLVHAIVWAQLPNFSMRTPELAGTLRFGLIQGETSVWLSDCKTVRIKTEQHETVYIIEHKLLEKGTIEIRTRSLLDTSGQIFKISARNTPETIRLFWAYGGALGEEVQPKNSENLLIPQYCADNVFSVEGNAFTVYYGTSRRLRIYDALVPPASEIRLSDALKQSTPLDFFNSGKKTDAPALAAISPIKPGEPLYFCFFKQNPKADYNYFMLPKLYEKGSYEFHKETNWMQSTPD
jgi:hypothetical protein